MKGPAGLHMRNVEIEGVGPWMWRDADHWGWKHPKQEFPALRDLILDHAPRRHVIVQAGGCMGMYPRLLAEHFETVYTFEPDPVNFYCLVANCSDARIVKMQAALSDMAGARTFQPGPDFNAGLGTIADAPGSTIALPLDALALRDVDVMQFDCEGGEHKIIKGARDTIERWRPLIAVEKPDAALRITLEGLGYREVGRCGRMPDVVFSAQRK